MRFGIIGSSGGAALRAAVAILRSAGRQPRPLVITDRNCGLGQWARDEGFDLRPLAYDGAQAFSARALQLLRDGGCADVLLFYTRRVAAPLIDELCVSNIHPSLLPAFPGLHAVEQALAAGVGLLGATLHLVDAGLDTGPITAQVACALPDRCSLQRAQRLSYLHKVWLTLLWCERLEGPGAVAAQAQRAHELPAGAIATSSAGLADPLLHRAYAQWQQAVEAGGA